MVIFPGEGSNFCEGGVIPNCNEEFRKKEATDQINKLNRELDSALITTAVSGVPFTTATSAQKNRTRKSDRKLAAI